MSANDLQLLYEREKQELENLKRRLDEALSKEGTAENLLKEIEAKMSDLGSNIKDLENDIKALHSKKDRKLTRFATACCIVGTLLMTPVFYCVLGPIPKFLITLVKQIFENITTLLAIALSVICIMPSMGILISTYFILQKLIEFLLNKLDVHLTNKVMNSAEYKELVFLKSIALEKLERVKLEKDKVQQNKDALKKEYISLRLEYAAKKGVVEYLDKKINPVETTLNLNKSLKPNHDSDNKTED